MLLKRFAFILMSALIMACAAYSAVPPVISYQGKLMQPSGAPVPDGMYSIQFAVYDVPTGGTALWSETNGSIQLKDGLFAVMLGSVNNLPSNIFDYPNRFFGVKVGSDPEMIPRQQIASSAFSFRSAIAGSVDDGSITANKLADGAVTEEKIANNSISIIKLMSGIVIPSGSIIEFAGSTPPTGWLVCDGSEVSRLTYATLFDAIGTIYGSGDGSTTFNLPNLQDRFPLGSSSFAPLGMRGGNSTINLQHVHTTQDHVLTIAEMPSHTHSISWVSSNASDKCIPQGDVRGNWTGMQSGATGGNAPHNHGNTTSALPTAQNILNPYVAVNYIIKY